MKLLWGVAVGVVGLTASACGATSVASGARGPSPAATAGTATSATTTTPGSTTPSSVLSGPDPSAAPPPTGAQAATTLPPCGLSGGGADQTVPVSDVCASTGAPHFATPQAAMVYLAAAWDAGDVREVDYVTDSQGRAQMDSMASAMPNLQFQSCTANPAGDYTCTFHHDPGTSPPMTTPGPQTYPPGEAVFLVAPASAPGWYLTQVEHCD